MIISMSVSAPFYYIYGLVQDKVAVLLVTDYVYEMNEKCKHMKSFSYSVKEDLDVLVVKHLETIQYVYYNFKSKYLINSITI